MKENKFTDHLGRETDASGQVAPPSQYHQPPTEDKCNCERIRGTVAAYCPYHPKDSLEWEESFERVLKNAGLHLGYKQASRIEEIKSFIKQQIAKAKEEERARVRGVIEGKKGKYSWAPDYNLALTDILKEIGE